MALPTGSSGQSWKTFAPPPSIGAGAISLPLPIEHKILYEAPIGFYITCFGTFTGNTVTFGLSSFGIARKGTPDIQQVSWSLSTTTAPGVFDSIFFVLTDQFTFVLGDGNFHFGFGLGNPDPNQASGSRRGLYITSMSALPEETVAESPHLSLEPLNFESDLKVEGDIYIVPAGISVAPGMRIVDIGSFGQKYTGSFLRARTTESTAQIVARFTSSDAPTGTYLGLKDLVVQELVTVLSGGIGPLIRNDDWGGGMFMPTFSQVAVFGGSKIFSVPSGNFVTRDNLDILSGSLNVTSGNIYIQGNFARLEIIGTSASAFFTKGYYPQPWGRLTESNVTVVSVEAGTPALFDGTFLLIPSASTAELLELHTRVSGSWFPIITSSFALIDGGTY